MGKLAILITDIYADNNSFANKTIFIGSQLIAFSFGWLPTSTLEMKTSGYWFETLMISSQEIGPIWLFVP